MHRHRVRARVGGVDVDVPTAIFANGQFLRFINKDAGIITSSLGPGTTTINALATWGDTTGTQLLNTTTLLDNAGNMTDLVTLDGQDAPRITATLATASPTTNKLTKWASSSAPWKLDASSIEVVHADGADGLYFVQVINGVIPERWVLGPISGVSTDNAIVRWDGTTGRLVQDSAVAIDDSGNITGVTTINGTTPGNWVQGPASSSTDHIALFNGSTGKLIKESIVSIDSSGNLSGVNTINTHPVFFGPNTATANGIPRYTSANIVADSLATVDASGNMVVNTLNTVNPANWVQGPASATTNALATYNGTTGKLIQSATTITASGTTLSNVGAVNSITVGSTTLSGLTGLNSITVGTSSLSSVTTINSIDPSTWVVGPASATDNALARFDGTTGKLIQNSGVSIDDSANIAGVNTLNGLLLTDLVKGRVTFFGGTTGLVPGYGLPQHASSYRVGFVAFVPLTFGDSSVTLTLSMSSDDNNGDWQVHTPNSSGTASLGTSGTWANGGTWPSASFIFAATAVVPSGSGTYSLSLSISSSGGAPSMGVGWQMWCYQ